MPYEHYDARYEEEEEIDLFEVAQNLWKRRGFIFLITFIFGAIATTYAFLAPFIYRAECRILPPGAGTGSGGLSSMLGGLGGLASMAGLPTKATSGGLVIGILKGDTVVDAIIDKFNLMEEYEIERRLDARKAVLKTLETDEDATSGIVSVAYLDKDPQKAADIANEFVNQLQIKLREMSFIDAQEKRTFFENQLMQAQQELSDAENAMMKYQQNSGVLALGSQTAALLGSIASLRGQIAAKNVEISSLSSYARKDNPRLKLANSQLEAMTRELHRLEEEQRKTEQRQGKVFSGDILSSLGNVPELSVEYMRYERAMRFANAKYERMLSQYETAKLSEASDLSTVQIVDPATPPDWKYKPKRAQIMIMGTFLGFFLSCGWVFVKYMIQKRNEESGEYYDD